MREWEEVWKNEMRKQKEIEEAEDCFGLKGGIHLQKKFVSYKFF